MNKEKYNPSQEEISKAEEMMSHQQKLDSDERAHKWKIDKQDLEQLEITGKSLADALESIQTAKEGFGNMTVGKGYDIRAELKDDFGKNIAGHFDFYEETLRRLTSAEDKIKKVQDWIEIGVKQVDYTKPQE